MVINTAIYYGNVTADLDVATMSHASKPWQGRLSIQPNFFVYIFIHCGMWNSIIHSSQKRGRQPRELYGQIFKNFLPNYYFCSGHLIYPVISRIFGLNGWKLNKFWTLTIIEQFLIYIFLHYQVNLNRPCPFWPDDGACALRDCSVAPCKEVCDDMLHLFNIMWFAAIGLSNQVTKLTMKYMCVLSGIF